ncbi:hypothetical protein BD324DRAFT_288649 [Kockovaella imperatae]|uniref:Uncharacterized protein n=1 Tax=Kockovaella imperatae TaxID=4999 RepID=A0A1Y1U705_9TREE|nr:hypothetical protein BD324DRAFT_288649 [Kockovaella imperatae]ORX33287.1 hypothetical protein BD324DRAFT_288649 [Kockovaella imperatae]
MVTWSPQKPHTPPSDSAPPPATQDSELGSGRRRDCTTSPPRKRTRVSDEPENRALNESAAAAVESLQSILTVTGNEEPALLGRRLALALRPQQASFHIRIPLDALGNADAPHILDDLPSPSHTLLSFRTVIHVCPDGVLDVSGFGSHLTNSEVLKTFPDGLAPIQNLSSKTYDISQRRRVTRHSVTPRPAVSLPAIISNDTRHEGISTSNELDDPGFGDILTHQSALALLRTGVKDHTIAATWSFVRPILVGDALFHLRPTLQIHPDGILPLPDPDNIQRRHAQAMARSIPSLSLLPIPCPKIDVLSIASRPHDIYTSDTVAAILSGLALCFMATHPNQSISCGLSMKPISVIDAGVEIRQDWETSVVFLMNRPCGEEVNQQIRVESLDRLFGVILLDGSWVAVSLVKDDEDVVIFTQKPSQPHPDHSTASVVDMLRDGALGELVKRFFPSVSPRYRFKPQFSTMTPATSGPVALQIIRLLLQQGAIGSMALTFGGHSEHELEKRWRLRQAEWAVQRLEAEQQLRGVLQLLARNPRTDT